MVQAIVRVPLQMSLVFGNSNLRQPSCVQTRPDPYVSPKPRCFVRRGPEGHVKMRFLRSMVSGIPRILEFVLYDAVLCFIYRTL